MSEVMVCVNANDSLHLTEGKTYSVEPHPNLKARCYRVRDNSGEEILSVVSPIRVGDVFRSKTSKFEHTVLYVDDEHALTSYEVDNGVTKLVWSLDDMDQLLERIKSDG